MMLQYCAVHFILVDRKETITKTISNTLSITENELYESFIYIYYFYLTFVILYLNVKSRNRNIHNE
jgi:hypothetical protein